jgi:hypothetical protein
MVSSALSTILIIDPHEQLSKPYQWLPSAATLIHSTSTPQATQYLRDRIPSLVIISASFSPSQMLELLETVKRCVSHQRFLVPLIVMVDLHDRINFIPGTHWGQKMGVLCSLSSKEEVNAVLNRICAEQKTFGHN